MLRSNTTQSRLNYLTLRKWYHKNNQEKEKAYALTYRPRHNELNQKNKTKLCKCGCGEYCFKNYKKGHALIGRPKTEITKEKLRQSHLGKHASLETKQKQSVSHQGFRHTEETKQMLSQMFKGRHSPLKGKNISEKHRKNISISKMGNKNPFFGKRHSPENLEKMRVASLGNKNSLGVHPSIETRKKLVAIRTGKHTAKLGTKTSPEIIVKLCAYQQRFCKTPEGKEKMKHMQSALTKTSKPQRELFKLLQQIFPEVILEHPIKTNYNYRFADIAIPALKLDFEYDGYFAHNAHSKEKNERRDRELIEVGWKTIRVNEEQRLALFKHPIFTLLKH
jgi:hypothetical protein